MIRIKIYKLLLAFCFFCNICYSQDSSAYTIAINFYLNAKFADAIYWFSKSIEKNYRVADSYRYAGISNAFQKNFDEARANLFYSLKLDSFNDRTYYQIGKYYFLLENYDSAIVWTTRAIVKNPTDPSSFDTRAMSYLGIQKFEKGISDELIAIKLNPNKSMYYNNCGLILQKATRYDDAVANYKKALSIDSLMNSNDLTYINMAFCYLKLQMPQQALQLCNKVLDQIPNSVRALEVRGLVYYSMSKKEEACNDFNRLYKLDKTLGKSYVEEYCK